MTGVEQANITVNICAARGEASKLFVTSRVGAAVFLTLHPKRKG